MSKPAFILLLTALVLAAGVINFYFKNAALAREIAANNERCEQQITAKSDEYRMEIDDLRNFLMSYYNYSQPEKTEKKPKPRFNQFLSYSHRVKAVQSKYEFILQTALISDTEKIRLSKVLTDRERVASLIEQQKENADDAAGLAELEKELDEIEAEIHLILNDEVDYIRYLTLRERHL